MRFYLAILVLALSLLPSMSYASTPSDCEQAFRYAKQNTSSAVLFADVSSGIEETTESRLQFPNPKEKMAEGWKRFSNRKELDAAYTGENLNTIAEVWLKSPLPVVNLTLQSPSGDWVHYVQYCYSSEGLLKKIDAELRTFHGNMIIKEVRDYKSDGTLIKKTKTYSDLDSGDKVSAKGKDGLGYQDAPFTEYKKLESLPFHSLFNLKSPRPAERNHGK